VICMQCHIFAGKQIRNDPPPFDYSTTRKNPPCTLSSTIYVVRTPWIQITIWIQNGRSISAMLQIENSTVTNMWSGNGYGWSSSHVLVTYHDSDLEPNQQIWNLINRFGT
jgi:hypothetical protein